MNSLKKFNALNKKLPKVTRLLRSRQAPEDSSPFTGGPSHSKAIAGQSGFVLIHIHQLTTESPKLENLKEPEKIEHTFLRIVKENIKGFLSE